MSISDPFVAHLTSRQKNKRGKIYKTIIVKFLTIVKIKGNEPCGPNFSSHVDQLVFLAINALKGQSDGTALNRNPVTNDVNERIHWFNHAPIDESMPVSQPYETIRITGNARVP